MPDDFREEYQRRVDEEFKAAPLHRFIIDLRQLILHVRLPVSNTRETWQRDGISFQVELSSADLLERWDRWSAEARQYIQAGGEAIDLHGTVVTYTEKVVAFDRWVAEDFVREHRQEIESYQEAARQHQTRLHQLGLYTDPPETA